MTTSTTEKTCKQEACKRPYRAKGYCNVHYKAWRQGELPNTRYKTCSQADCLKAVAVHGRCAEHAGLKTEATPTAAAPTADAPAEATPAEAIPEEKPAA